MIRLYLTQLFVFSLSLFVYGQKNDYNEVNGDLAFEKYKYEEAVVFYQEALTKSPDDHFLKLKIAESYRKMNNHVVAADWYSQVLDAETVDVDDIYKLHYAQALLYNGDNANAKKWFEAYQQHDPDSKVPDNRLQGIENFDVFLEREKYFSIEKMNFNSPSKDFSPHFFKEGLIFVSDRTTDEGKNPWDNRVFLNLFYTKISEDGTFYTPEELSRKLNTMYHEGPVSVYNNGKRIAFTRNNYHKRVLRRSNDGINNLQILFADVNENNQWKNLEKFPHNSREYSTGHPAMNSDGTLMVFSSDRPGGLGGSDIYYSQLVDGQWSEPVNLGPEINTQGDELFPYLFSDSILYFSSNGHYGLGGLDVYQSVFDEEKSHSIKNMGVPINSNADDFGFIIHERGTMGYFSSNRESYENDDIYRFRILPIGVSIQLVDAGTGKSLSNGNISIAQENASEMLTYSGDPLRYLVDYNTSYTIEASAGGYQPGHYTFDAEALEPGQLKEIAIKMKSLKAPEPEPQPAQVIVPADVAEVVEIGNKTYIGVDGELFSPEDMNISMDSLKTMKENRGDTAESIEIENIYYEHNKFDLKTQARKTIHGIVLLMEKYKSAILEIASHTDSKGSKSYNERLAQDRSNRVVEYLDSLGVDKNRLRATSYGETRLLNNCSDGVPCTPAEHRMNRRTEFVLKLE